ncbi:MAG: hypothetical protein GF313_13505 [Caldithrix sp.]|nr:hypothetical protein [Caldithrix sp.]
MYKFIILLVATCTALAQNASDKTYTKTYQNKLLFLHARANYALNEAWNYRWQAKRINSNGLRLSFGSVEKNDLLSKLDLIVNQQLNSDWHFHLNYYWHESQYPNKPEQFIYMGLERRIYKNLSTFLHFNPSFDKEAIDFRSGFILTNDDRTQYVKVALDWNDFIYQAKNDRGGITQQDAKGIYWLMRYKNGSFTFFSSGIYNPGFKRKFPDLIKSPDLRMHNQQITRQIIKLYYHFDRNTFLQLGYNKYHFEEGKSYTEINKNYSYRNAIAFYSLKYLTPLNNRWYLRTALHCIKQSSNADADEHLQIERREILPAVYLDYRYGKHSAVELAYMGTTINWDYNNAALIPNAKHETYTEKIKLGWNYHFSKKSRVQFSLSHVISYWGFGGANVQYELYF